MLFANTEAAQNACCWGAPMKYQFFRVAVIHKPRDSPTRLLEQKIHEIAADGWRLVQVLVEVPAAVPYEYVIIAEREGDA
jgi:hypothetical protein